MQFTHGRLPQPQALSCRGGQFTRTQVVEAGLLSEPLVLATLDPTSRGLRFPREHEVITTDTVGLTRDLPKDLVAAFRATLEDASVVLHVTDASDPARHARVEAVEAILGALDLLGQPRLEVSNATDRLSGRRVAALERAPGRAGGERAVAAWLRRAAREGRDDALR